MVEPSKDCFKCGQHFPLSEFYRHPATGDGRLGKCKECTKKDVHDNYIAKLDQYKRYEKDRFKKAERKKAIKEYAKRRPPEKVIATRKTSNAIRSGKLTRQPCERCGEPKTQAHHDDYSKPLDVRWLCFVCHRIHHGQLKYLSN